MSIFHDLAITPDADFADALERRLIDELSVATRRSINPVVVELGELEPDVDIEFGRFPHRHRRRRTVAAFAAAAAIVTALVIRSIASGGAQDPDKGVTTDSLPSSTLPATTVSTEAPAPTTTIGTLPRRTVDDLPAVQPLDALGASPIATLDRPSQLVTDGDTVWVSLDDGPVIGFDAVSGTKGATLDVTNGARAARPVVAFDSLWVLTEVGNELRRFDPVSGALQATIPIDGRVDSSAPRLAMTSTGLYVLTVAEVAELHAIDPAENAVSSTVPVNAAVYGLVAAGERLYGLTPGSIIRIDPANGAILARVTAPVSEAVTPAAGSVWAVIGDNGVMMLRFDQDDLSETARIDLPGRRDAGPMSGTLSADSLWMTSSADLLLRIDPTQNRVVGRYGSGSGGGVTATSRDLWFTDYSAGVLYRAPLT